jgi:hypothetical protein
MGMEGGGIMAEKKNLEARLWKKVETYILNGVNQDYYIKISNQAWSDQLAIVKSGRKYTACRLEEVQGEELFELAQFIEDNYPTLTLEQLDNIEEVYLKSKEKK